MLELVKRGSICGVKSRPKSKPPRADGLEESLKRRLRVCSPTMQDLKSLEECFPRRE